MDAKVTWQEGLEFAGSADNGHPVRLAGDAAGDSISPMQMVAISLAGCTAMDVISILKKKQQAVTHFEVAVHADRSEDYPKVFTRAELEYQVTGHQVDEAALLRAIDLSMTKYCPVHAMLEKSFPIELSFSIFEGDGEGQSRLVKRGKVQTPA